MALRRPAWFDRLTGRFRELEAGDDLLVQGKVNAIGLEAVNGGSDTINPAIRVAAEGANGAVGWLINAVAAKPQYGVLLCPKSSDENTNTLIEFDGNDYTFYDRVNDSYNWVIGGNLAAQLTSSGFVGIREKLTANRTYYVSNSGSNSNDGLSSGTPFQTI